MYPYVVRSAIGFPTAGCVISLVVGLVLVIRGGTSAGWNAIIPIVFALTGLVLGVVIAGICVLLMLPLRAFLTTRFSAIVSGVLSGSLVATVFYQLALSQQDVWTLWVFVAVVAAVALLASMILFLTVRERSREDRSEMEARS